jgi:hypothetical protein
VAVGEIENAQDGLQDGVLMQDLRTHHALRRDEFAAVGRAPAPRTRQAINTLSDRTVKLVESSVVSLADIKPLQTTRRRQTRLDLPGERDLFGTDLAV